MENSEEKHVYIASLTILDANPEDEEYTYTLKIQRKKDGDEDEDDGWADIFKSDDEGDHAPPESDLVHRLCSVDLCEVFSPPRVVREAKRYGLSPGEAMDLTTGWDFNLESHRKAAEEYVDREKPLAIIGSPPCTPFSQLQSLSPCLLYTSDAADE